MEVVSSGVLNGLEGQSAGSERRRATVQAPITCAGTEQARLSKHYEKAEASSG